MPHARRIVALVAVLLVALCACASRGPAPPARPPGFGSIDERLTTQPPIPLLIEPLEANAGVSAGDGVLLGIIIRKGGVETVRFVEIRISESFQSMGVAAFSVGPPGQTKREYTSARVAGSVRLLDENGHVLREGQGGFAVFFLASGLMNFARVLEAEHHRRAAEGDSPPAQVSDSDRTAVETGVCTLLAFSTQMNSNSDSIFRAMVMDFIGFRGVLAALTSFGSFSLDTNDKPVAGTVRLPGSGREMPAYSLPMQASFGRTPVIDCVLTIVEPVMPLTLTAGIVRADLSRPSNPDDRITVQLLAATRGHGVSRR